MKKFKKGDIETIVEDDDRRIPQYKANGWEEVPLVSVPDTEKEGLNRALDDVQESEKSASGKGKDKENGKSKGKGKGKAGKETAKTADTDKKVNEAVEANSNAASESVEVDDGLEKQEE